MNSHPDFALFAFLVLLPFTRDTAFATSESSKSNDAKGGLKDGVTKRKLNNCKNIQSLFYTVFPRPCIESSPTNGLKFPTRGKFPVVHNNFTNV